MSATYLIPLLPQPQRLAVQLAGVNYNLRTYWNGPVGCWNMDIADADDNPILGGIALVTGADLLEQFGYLDFGGQLVVYDTVGPADAVPGFSGLGTTGGLYFVTPG